jgi:hypothetical protein
MAGAQSAHSNRGETFMANETLNETAPAVAENRETTTASPAAAKSAKSAPARRKKAAAKTRSPSAAKRGKAPAKRGTASRRRPLKQASTAPVAPAAALPRAAAGRTGLGGTVADLVESNARPFASAQEQLASATRGTWIAPVAEFNARAITQVAAAQARVARRLLG